MCILVIFMSFLEKCTLRYSAHFSIGFFFFFFALLSCMSCLFILEIKPPFIASFANIFSHSIGCLLYMCVCVCVCVCVCMYIYINGFLCCAKAYKFD